MGVLNQDINTFDRATQEWASQTEWGYDCGDYKVFIPYSFKDKFGILQVDSVAIVDDTTSGLPYTWSKIKENKKLILKGALTKYHPDEICEKLYHNNNIKKSEVCLDIKVTCIDGSSFDFMNAMMSGCENIEPIFTPEPRYKSDITFNCDYWKYNF